MSSSKQDPGEPLDHDSATGSGGSAETELYTLGHVRLIEQGSEQSSKLGPKHLALLIYLAHERRSMHPTEVTEILGRGQEEDKEIAALRRAVGWLSENVLGVNIRMSADLIDPVDSVWVDSAEVDGAIDRGDPKTVAQLYVGEFLEGFESGSQAFDEWATKERGRVKRAWSHAMLAASRRAEQDNEWDVAAQWWQLLVARAPMRPEAVASLLSALMKAGQEDKATTAYFSYAALLAESGISQPADPVKEVLAEYLTLQESTGVRVDLTEQPEVEELEETEELVESDTLAADSDEAGTEPAEPAAEHEQEHTFESLSAALDAEFESEIHIGPQDPDAEAVTTEDEAAVADEAVPEPETDAPKVIWPDEEFVPQDEETGEEEWQDVVELASSDEIDIDLSGELQTETLQDEMQTPVSEPIAGLDDDEEIFQADHEVLAEDEMHELAAEPAPPTAAELRETPYDRGAAYMDAQPEIAAEEESDEAERPGMMATGASAAGGPARALFGAPKDFGRKLGTLAGSAVSGSSPLARLRHYWYVPIALGVAALAFVLGPKLLVTVGDLAEDLPEVNTPALPKVNLPKVSVKTPGFVETSVSRIGELLSGPILEESGQWVVVADFQLETPPGLAPVVGDTGLEESGQTEGVSGDGSEIDPSVVADTSPSIEPQDSATTTREDTTRVRPPVSVVSVSPEHTAPGNSDAGTPGVGLALRENSIAAAESPLRRASEAASQDTTRQEQQDTTQQEQQDTTPPAQQDTIQGTPEVSDSTAVADTIQSIGTDSIPGQAQDSAVAGPTPVAAADSVEQPAAKPQERLSLTALTMVVEADLDQAEFFNVVPRERALNALQSLEGRTSEALPVEAALQLAGSEGWGAVVSGRVELGAEADSLKLLVLNAAGDTLYGVAAEVPSQAVALEIMAELTHAVRRRLGEPGAEVDASRAVADVLSPTHAALNAYSEARADLYAGRLPQAVSAASEAVQRDTTFVLAYLVLADAYAQGGVRAPGRSALEDAWSLSGQASERDSMRIHADRLAWDGRFSEAVVTYDELFQRYRDDVAALKSQALLQRMIGARGGGEGNLRVAYTIDPYDWPRLSRIARYLGYTGTLPDVDSLIASLQEPLSEEAPAEDPASEEQQSEG